MFKAKLIEDEKYYGLRKKQLILTLLPSILYGLIANFYQLPVWITVLVIGLYILSFILWLKNQKSMNFLSGHRKIEVDQQEIRIKSQKGEIEEVILIDELDKIILQDNYSMPQETLKEVGQEVAGTPKQNYFILEKDQEQRRFDFEVESYYMLNQLNKISTYWKQNSSVIETLSE